MTFDRAWVLLFLILPAAWAAWEWRRSGRRGALLLKAASVAAVIAALAQPVLTIYETKVAVGVLVDTSSSMSAEDLERALIAQMHVWRWAGAVVLAVLAFPVIALFVAALMDVWP